MIDATGLAKMEISKLNLYKRTLLDFKIIKSKTIKKILVLRMKFYMFSEKSEIRVMIKRKFKIF